MGRTDSLRFSRDSETAAESIGRVLRSARESAGLSIARVARLTAFSESHLRSAENGNRVVTLDIAEAYDRALDAGGAIVNVSSGASRLGSPNEYVDYAASKGAIDTLTIGLAKEVAEEGIRVNAVRGGFIYTDIHTSGGEPGRVDRVKDLAPMKRGGQPHEVAHAILWLLSDEASYTTAAILDVTGGM